jgi:hypothetical protein
MTMFQIRDVFQVKFGKIDQAVELFTKLSKPASGLVVLGGHFEVLTDITGAMYTLVNEFVVENMGEFSQMLERQFAQPEFEGWFKQFQLFVDGGQREYYTVDGPIETWSRPGAIVVRETYRAFKWQIHTAVGLLQRYGGLLEYYQVGSKPRILTDFSGPMFRAVIEIETESMSAWEAQRRSLYREVEFQTWFKQMTTSVDAGTHEFYRVEYTSG